METVKAKEKFIELRAQGYSFDKIARKIGKAKQTLIDWSKELEEEIANLKAIELETIYEKHYLSKETRLRTFGEMLTRIRHEITNRELSEIPTDKLLELFLKYDKQLQDELVEPKFKTSQEIDEEKNSRALLEGLTTTPHPGKNQK